MNKRAMIWLGTAVAIAAVVVIGAIALGREGRSSQSTQTTSERPTGVPPVTGRTPASPDTTATAPSDHVPSPVGSADPALAVIKLVDARAAGDDATAKEVGSEQAVRQIKSYPPFNPREAIIACDQTGPTAAKCNLASSSAGISMILSLSKPDGNWRVDQIEPLID